ncbi:MAG: hypothetical protein FWF20_00615 [Betaproteobacteria bacterium]|nr:hypothetical protein [Betaproteobacteria bacterium]MCL2885282.1 hypothetical protein [Betaproteobacteria bacterium]
MAHIETRRTSLHPYLTALSLALFLCVHHAAAQISRISVPNLTFGAEITDLSAHGE